MNRVAICLYLIVTAGCSPEPVPNTVNPPVIADGEDGGTVENADRDEAAAYFMAFGNVRSAEEEVQLLREFGAWLREKGYAIKVDLKNGKHDLSCPYFPPTTPWTSHSFFDVKNLKLLPLLENDG